MVYTTKNTMQIYVRLAQELDPKCIWKTVDIYAPDKIDRAALMISYNNRE